ncbi:photoreceptor cilium actin regulator [Chanos chanos]|uniref:Photoreceptor cilium actin regulator n=1 Tax=Chanos chanos TaxID=29144 RepID=A0A6J2V334_CHACN|nr:photoreceptor cilium actin regulator-like [Chanos chanos]
MGCSPSKGQLFGISGNHKALAFEPQENSDVPENQSQTKTGTEETADNQQENLSVLANGVCDTTTQAIIQTEEPVVPLSSQVNQGETSPDENLVRKADRKKKNAGGKRTKQKQKLKRLSYSQSKVDLPETMVKAHQAAYAYLNPNISKYEALLGLLDQAAQTHLSLQPMVALVVMRYEEINQALEEMANEGEQMLEQHGSHMAWPTALGDTPLIPAKPSSGVSSSEPPPDLLQQMLRHSTEKMRLVGDSVRGLGDSSLEEAADYFASLSKLLGEKLSSKQAAERRLKQILFHVEAAALRKPGLEDSALHSEDSGIGADNECHNGSERLRHRESYNKSDQSLRKSSTPNGDLVNSKCQRTPHRGKQPKRPKTSDNTTRQGKIRYRHLRGLKRAQSVESLFIRMGESTVELERNRRDLNLRPELNGKGAVREKKEGGMVQSSLVRARLRRHSSGGHSATRYQGFQYGSKGLFKATPPSSCLPSLRPEPPGRNAVKRLINTFSKGIEDKTNHKDVQGPRWRGLPALANGKTSLINDSNSSNSNCNGDPNIPDRPNDLDMESLPPPPPEVLMDNSFESTRRPSGDERGRVELMRGQSSQRQKTALCQRLRASVQSASVLPNRPSVRQGSLSTTVCPVRQDAVVEFQTGEDVTQQDEVDPKRDEAALLYQQSRKIIHLRHFPDSPAKTAQAHQGNNAYSTIRPEAEMAKGGGEPHDGEPAAAVTCPPTTPPVSRARLPPSSPSVHHTIQSSAVFRSQPTPSCPVSHWRAPSPPPSSSVQRWTRENGEEENGIMPVSQSFTEARSVFSQASKSTTQTWIPSCTSTLPRPWGESSRGRLTSTRLPQTFNKQNLSHRDQQQPSSTNMSTQDQKPNSEPTTGSREGKDSGPPMEEKAGEGQYEDSVVDFSASKDEQCNTEQRNSGMLEGEG